MPAVAYPKDSTATKRVYIGLRWDDYTPQVEGQIMRDCMELLNTADSNEEVVLVINSDKADRLIDGLGMRRVPTGQLAKMWILYRTKDELWPDLPEWATTEVRRDLLVKKKDPKILLEVDEEEANGYYLPPQGRLSPDTLSLERPAPNGYVPMDMALIGQWT